MRHSLLRSAALISALAFSTSALRAQSSRVSSRDEDSPRMPTQVISVNPFLPLFGFFQGEYEHRLADNASIGISGAHMKLDDLYTSLDVKLRLYPQERVLEKLGLSAGLGYGRVRTETRGTATIRWDRLTLPHVTRNALCQPPRFPWRRSISGCLARIGQPPWRLAAV
jgi:hypothetical protein